MLFASACSRADLDQDIVVKVFDESKASTPFGLVKSERRLGAGVAVYLIPGDTPLQQLTSISPDWVLQKTNSEGDVTFREVEGVYHIGVDANGDQILDASVSKVPSGARKTITITSYAPGDDDANQLRAHCGDDVYHPYENAKVTIAGSLAETTPVSVQLWHDISEDRKVLYKSSAVSFAGTVSHAVEINIKSAYPLTKPSTFDDYLVVPYALGKHFPGCRFSIRAVTGSTVIREMALLINNGDAEVSTRNVNLTAISAGAQSMAFSEDPSADPATLTRFKYGGNFGLQLSAGEGVKTVYAWFYDGDGNYAGPVSDSILLNTDFPDSPVQGLIYVIMNAPGMDDLLAGFAGAVPPGYRVRVYKGYMLGADDLLSEVNANADGSFGPLNIGDGSAGNVVKPQDFVYLTATDAFSRESLAVAAYNDSTPPFLQAIDFYGAWISERPSGQVGDTFEVVYTRPEGYPPAADVSGGHVDFSEFGGSPNLPMTALSADLYRAAYTVPSDADMNQSGLRVYVSIHDAAYNTSATTTSLASFAIDTVAPAPITLQWVSGRNQSMAGWWDDPNTDTYSYLWRLTDEMGGTQTGEVSVLRYCELIGQATPSCINYWEAHTKNIPYDPGNGSGGFVFNSIGNCHWYYVDIAAVDGAGNISAYSNAISDRVILPPPSFNAWGALSTSGDGALIYSIDPVDNGARYELYVDLDSGVPYSLATTDFSSPVTLSNVSGGLYLGRINGLPLGEIFYLNARSIDNRDPTCRSDYAQEMTAMTDLRIEALSDGVTVNETIGGALARVKDFDGDGEIDLLVGSTSQGYVAAVSGSTGARINTFGSFIAPDAYPFPGQPLAAADIDADGKDEFLVGSPIETGGGFLLGGIVRIYDDDMTLLHTIPGDSVGRHFGFAVENLGDIDFDGADDIAIGGFGCKNADCGYSYDTFEATQGPGQVVIYSGAALSGGGPVLPIVTHVGTDKGDFFGVSIAGGKDYNGDGTNDYAIGSSGTRNVAPTPQLRIYSGATHQVILTRQLSEAPGQARHAASLAFIDDINDDGRAELVIGKMGLTVNGSVSVLTTTPWGGTYIQWTQNGESVLVDSDVEMLRGFGSVIATGGDINGDGTPEIVVGAPGVGLQNGFYGIGAAFVLDGRSGRFLYELRGAEDDGIVGYSALIPGNLNAGPRDEWVVGAPGSAYGGYQSGRLYILTTDP